MRLLPFSMFLLLLLSVSARADVDAQLVQDANLHQAPVAQSPVLMQMNESDQVLVKTREGGWYQVESESIAGWVKMFYLRFNSQPLRQGKIGINALLGSTQKPHSDMTLTTGVRGITEKMLKESKPDFVALGRVSTMSASEALARSFAHSAGLQPLKIPYRTSED